MMTRQEAETRARATFDALYNEGSIGGRDETRVIAAIAEQILLAANPPAPNLYYPAAPSNTYIPSSAVAEEPPDIEYVREHGVVVSANEERTLACAETHKGMTVFFSRVHLNPDGTIRDFAEQNRNKYRRATHHELGEAGA